MSRIIATAIFALTLCALTSESDAQGTPALVISAPTSGSPATPGQSLAVTVTVNSGTYPAGVAIVGQDPLGGVGPTPAAPSVAFSLVVPTTTPPGTYSLTALAVDSTGTLVSSAPITVDVERSETVTGLLPQPTTVQLRFVGDSIPLNVFGTLSTGMQINLTRSSALKLVSENSAVASVQNGTITATGPGSTNIDIQYGTTSAKVSVTVPSSSAKGDLNGDGRVDQSDLNIILAALNSQANGTADARDLNHDGVINTLDARILVTLCTYPRCATHQ